MYCIDKLQILIHFSRPHTIIGTIAASSSIFIFTNLSFKYPLWNNLIFLAIYLGMALSLNIFVVGINQMFDRQLDAINKPYLPLSSGELSVREGWTIIAVAATVALFISFSNFILFTTSILILIIGIIYSVPPIRLRGNFLPASFLILTGRGIILTLSSFLYFRYKIDRQLLIPKEIWYILFFVSLHTIVISIFKDLPDTKGDYEFRIQTLPVVFTTSRTYKLSITIMILNYIVATYLILRTKDLTKDFAIIPSIYHVIIIFCLFASIFLEDSILSRRHIVIFYYKLIWLMLYFEYYILSFTFGL